MSLFSDNENKTRGESESVERDNLTTFGMGGATPADDVNAENGNTQEETPVISEPEKEPENKKPETLDEKEPDVIESPPEKKERTETKPEPRIETKSEDEQEVQTSGCALMKCRACLNKWFANGTESKCPECGHTGIENV